MYVFKQDGKILLEGENLITFYGESFFLNRCINDKYNPIQYIAIGNAESIPLRTDTVLGNETLRKTCFKQVDSYKKAVKLTCSFTASDIVGTTEIGVYCSNQERTLILISHDIFERIESSLLTNLSGTVEVEYSFLFTTATTRNDWNKLSGYENVYYLYEPSNVVGVVEDKVNGYSTKLDINGVEDNLASYYYDSSMTRNLYIHTTDGKDPATKQILIQTKEDNMEENE